MLLLKYSKDTEVSELSSEVKEINLNIGGWKSILPCSLR